MAPLQLGGLAIDVYEQEASLFFRDPRRQSAGEDYALLAGEAV